MYILKLHLSWFFLWEHASIQRPSINGEEACGRIKPFQERWGRKRLMEGNAYASYYGFQIWTIQNAGRRQKWGFLTMQRLDQGQKDKEGWSRKKNQVKVLGRRNSLCKDPEEARRGSVLRTSRRVVGSSSDSRFYFPKSHIWKEGEMEYQAG